MRDTARQFLDQSGWRDPNVTPVAGDLSARHYFRVSTAGRTAILMDAGNDETSTRAFQKITDWLLNIGLSAPHIYAAQPEYGLLLLEDFGTTPARQMLANDAASSEIYDASIRVLLDIRNAAPPALTCPDAGALCDWTRLADDFYPSANPAALDTIRADLETVLADCLTARPSLSLRDFHVDNMMWLPERTGPQRLGLLDYQDAFLTHPVYDLVSLLTDARTLVPPPLREKLIKSYAQASRDDHRQLSRAFAAFSVQRNLRILGIFHRAAKVDGKTHHLPKVPRVYGYLSEAMEHPVFDGVRPLLSLALPAPEIAP